MSVVTLKKFLEDNGVELSTVHNTNTQWLERNTANEMGMWQNYNENFQSVSQCFQSCKFHLFFDVCNDYYVRQNDYMR